MAGYQFTNLQGQYLAFIYNYTVIHREPPSEGDMQQLYKDRPPTHDQPVVRWR